MIELRKHTGEYKTVTSDDGTETQQEIIETVQSYDPAEAERETELHMWALEATKRTRETGLKHDVREV